MECSVIAETWWQVTNCSVAAVLVFLILSLSKSRLTGTSWHGTDPSTWRFMARPVSENLGRARHGKSGHSMVRTIIAMSCFYWGAAATQACGPPRPLAVFWEAPPLRFSVSFWYQDFGRAWHGNIWHGTEHRGTARKYLARLRS